MHPDLQLRLYFLQERRLDHTLETRRLVREREGSTTTTAHGHKRSPLARARRG